MANLLVFRTTASSFLRLVEDDDDTLSTAHIAKQIVKESKELISSNNVYKTKIDKETAAADVSPTLQSLLSKICKEMNSLPVILMGNMVTSIVTKRPTTLQVALGVLVRSKSLVETLHEFGVTCTYDEMLRFKSSAAADAAQNSILSGISSSNDGLVQTVADNFDANISSQNGLCSTHALALLVTQNKSRDGDPLDKDFEKPNPTIRRLRKEDMKQDIIPNIPVYSYHGPKKPAMPPKEAKRTVLPLRLLVQQSISVQHAQMKDFLFLKNILGPNCTVPDYSGYNTMLSRQQGHALRDRTFTVYTPLIDMVPSDPTTMMTAMVEAQRLTHLTGQNITVYTNDQQLYRVAVNIAWVYPDLFHNFIPRLGGMHILMNFVGAIGHLMENSGLEEVLKSAFAGIPRMLSGKKFPQNTRALRLVVEEVLRDIMLEAKDYSDLIQILDMKASISRTSKHWIQNLIKPVLIIMTFVRAEREGDWSLHLWSVRHVCCWSCKLCTIWLYYLRSMERMPKTILTKFLKGDHVMRHQPGLWNCIWSDMFIETTFMRYGHSAGGLIGISLKLSSVKRWAYSLHHYSQLINDIHAMTEVNSKKAIETHKEEMTARIKADSVDRNKLRKKLEMCIDPLSIDHHTDCIVNIATGAISSESVNVDKSVSIGEHQLQAFKANWPESFKSSLTKQIVTMSDSRRKIKLGEISLFDTNLIYSRVMGLIGACNIDLKTVFQHELSPIPTSMFGDDGEMRITKSKSTLKQKLKVEHSARLFHPPEGTIIDGCAILWTINWPVNGTLQDFINNYKYYIFTKLKFSNIYLVFD